MGWWLVGAAMPGALTIPQCFLDPKQLGMAGESLCLTRRIDLPVLGPGSDWRRLGLLAPGGSEVPE